MNDLHRKYTLIPRFNRPKHEWVLLGAHGAIQIHVVLDRDDFAYGGVEIHSRTPLDSTPSHAAPSQYNCAILNGWCWTDGSSLAIDRIANEWRFPDIVFHDFVYAEALRWYKSRFPYDEEETN